MGSTGRERLHWKAESQAPTVLAGLAPLGMIGQSGRTNHDGREKMEGGCQCGAVRYVAEGEPINSGICHCETCRRIASAPRLPFVGMPSAGFRFTRGAPVDYASSPGVTRSFCGRCGSPLTYRRRDTPGELDVMTVSLDNPSSVPPTFHVWTSEALDWDRLAGDLPAYPRTRNG